jgi:hypothetical protein
MSEFHLFLLDKKMNFIHIDLANQGTPHAPPRAAGAPGEAGFISPETNPASRKRLNPEGGCPLKDAAQRESTRRRGKGEGVRETKGQEA